MGLDFFNWETQKRILDPGGFVWDKPSNAPTQYANEDQFQALLRGGQGDPNAAYWSQDVTHMQAPQMAQTPQMQGAQLQMGDDPFRRAQLQQMGQLQGIASGQQQGAGELAVQRQMQNAMAGQQAQARMARGGSAALAYRNAANQQAALGSTAAGMGQQAALGDQQAAQGMLGQVGAQGRSADIGVANANAGYQQGAAQNNQQVQYGTNQANQQVQYGTNQANAGNYLQLLGMQNQRDISKYNADLGIGAQQDAAAAAKQGGLVAGIGSVAAMFSDERLKTNVTDARADIDAMLDGLRGPVSWEYKDRKHGEGRWDGLMAQDLEKSTAGARIVSDTPEGKMLDVKKAVWAALASSARLNERLRALESKR